MPKVIKSISVAVKECQLDHYKGDVLIAGLFEGTKRVPKSLTGMDKSTGQSVGNLLKLGDFKGKANETAVLYNSKANFGRIILVGLGDKKKIELNTLRQAAGTVVRLMSKMDVTQVGMAIHADEAIKLKPELMGQAISEGVMMGRYDYLDYMPVDKDEKTGPMKVTLVEPDARVAMELKKGCKIGLILAQGQTQTRMLANTPGNEINPPELGREAQRLARKFGLKCKVFNDKQLAEMKMNAILAVGQGSINKPRLIMLEYVGRKGKKASPDVVLVGKAITFDSGGISIKPSLNMETMKYDKSGGCSVMGVMAAVSQLKLGINVTALIPAAENMPGYSSYRPGDIIRTYSGKTVEVQNTDAEGRLILCDALAYGAQMKPKAIVDMATLTGAVVVALGQHHAGLFGNNDSLMGKVKDASKASGEPMWIMPIGGAYLEMMRSKMADLKNVCGREGGASTAASFLSEFVGDVPWAHIDIAAVADTPEEKPYRSSGATGYAVRAVLEYLRSF
ncbi:MAG: leucyl aminopeptidase [Phycisphaerae bacterium]|nr:leucyl aminopeptidase [Phycisphaerae bacterium]